MRVAGAVSLREGVFRPRRLAGSGVRSVWIARAFLAAGAVLMTGMPASGSPSSEAPAMAYRLTCHRPSSGTVHVAITPSDGGRGGRTLVMPRAVPMAYEEARYDDFVSHVRATSPRGGELACAREDGPRWRVGGPDDVVATIEYDVDVRRMEETVLDAHLASKVRDGYVGLLGVGVFAYLEGAERLPVILDVEGPDGWPVLTTLAPETFGPRAQRGRADDFHDLADSQIAMGPSLQVRRVEGEVPLTVAMYAEADGDLEQVATLASTALRQTIAYFGRAPFPRYTLLLEYLKPVSPRHRSGMSLEHLNGASCHLEADKAITAASEGPDKARALYNFAHHIAHAWIPKRCYGQGYFPPSWEIAPVLDSLWLSEGFVQYAAIVAISADDDDPDASRRRRVQRRFRDELATLPRFLLEMPLVELSRVASTRYGADFRTGRALYARGGLMAAEIDNTIRAATCGRKTLRDALRSLVAWSDREGKAFAIADLPGRFAEATGVDTREVFERWLGPMPVR